MKKLLVICDGQHFGEYTIAYHLLVAETGEHLASHMCSSKEYAEGDLYSHRPERIEDFKKRFGEVEVKFLEDTKISQEEMLKRNKSFKPETV